MATKHGFIWTTTKSSSIVCSSEYHTDTDTHIQVTTQAENTTPVTEESMSVGIFIY
jgi:hypothetical protein